MRIGLKFYAHLVNIFSRKRINRFVLCYFISAFILAMGFETGSFSERLLLFIATVVMCFLGSFWIMAFFLIEFCFLEWYFYTIFRKKSLPLIITVASMVLILTIPVVNFVLIQTGYFYPGVLRFSLWDYFLKVEFIAVFVGVLIVLEYIRPSFSLAYIEDCIRFATSKEGDDNN